MSCCSVSASGCAAVCGSIPAVYHNTCIVQIKFLINSIHRIFPWTATQFSHQPHPFAHSSSRRRRRHPLATRNSVDAPSSLEWKAGMDPFHPPGLPEDGSPVQSPTTSRHPCISRRRRRHPIRARNRVDIPASQKCKAGVDFFHPPGFPVDGYPVRHQRSPSRIHLPVAAGDIPFERATVVMRPHPRNGRWEWFPSVPLAFPRTAIQFRHQPKPFAHLSSRRRRRHPLATRNRGDAHQTQKRGR